MSFLVEPAVAVLDGSKGSKGSDRLFSQPVLPISGVLKDGFTPVSARSDVKQPTG